MSSLSSVLILDRRSDQITDRVPQINFNLLKSPVEYEETPRNFAPEIRNAGKSVLIKFTVPTAIYSKWGDTQLTAIYHIQDLIVKTKIVAANGFIV